MKTLFIVIAMMFAFSLNANAQREVKREGNTFSVVVNKSTTKDSGTKTKFTWRDSKGVEYPVYKSKRGAFYIIRTSKKSGKEYKQYLPKEVQAEMKNEL